MRLTDMMHAVRSIAIGLAWIACALPCASCSSAPAPAPAAVTTIAPAAPPPPPSSSATAMAAPASTSEAADGGGAPVDARWEPGQRVRARGRVSTTPWQHIVGGVSGKRAEYFDLATGGQTIVYVARPLQCPGDIEVEATVIEVGSEPKRPGKAGERVSRAAPRRAVARLRALISQGAAGRARDGRAR